MHHIKELVSRHLRIFNTGALSMLVAPKSALQLFSTPNFEMRGNLEMSRLLTHLQVQPIADRVAQNLEIIPKKNATNQHSACGLYE